MSTVVCEDDSCNQLTVAKCMHCNHHLCLKCLTRHQQPVDSQICQLTDAMNKLLSLTSVHDDEDDDDGRPASHPQMTAHRKCALVMEQIDLWEKTMTEKLNDLVSRARQSVRKSFEQISFEIEEWSTDRQVESQQLMAHIGKVCLSHPSRTNEQQSHLRTSIIDDHGRIQSTDEDRRIQATNSKIDPRVRVRPRRIQSRRHGIDFLSFVHASVIPSVRAFDQLRPTTHS